MTSFWIRRYWKNKNYKKRIKRFFGTSVLPEIKLDKETLGQITKDNTEHGYTVTGVRKKLSLHLLSNEEQPRLTLVNYPNGYILMPQV